MARRAQQELERVRVLAVVVALLTIHRPETAEMVERPAAVAAAADRPSQPLVPSEMAAMALVVRFG
jgi:hypothetical protein